MGRSNSTIVTVSSKGWVVIPSPVRKKIGLKPGMKVAVSEAEGKIVLTPQQTDPVDRLYGVLSEGESLTDTLLAEREKEKKREKAEVHS